MLNIINLLVLSILLSIISNAECIIVSRQDANYDIVLYMDGKPLQASTQLNMPAFQQVTSVTLPNGQVVPPTVQLVNGQMQVVPTPTGMSNLVITMQRSTYGSIYGNNNNAG